MRDAVQDARVIEANLPDGGLRRADLLRLLDAARRPLLQQASTEEVIQQEEKEKDYGTVVGVKGDAVALRNNIVNVANDENVFDPVVYVDPEIVEYDGKTLIGIRVPASGEIHSY